MTHMTRREALTATTAGVATLVLAPLSFAQNDKVVGYTLPKLPYDYDALKKSIDAETMKIHHTKHHQAYINNANTILKDHPKLLKMPVEDLLKDIKTLVPKELLQGAINNVGGHSNHSIFWTVMGPMGGGTPDGALGKAIDKAFGSFDKFQKEFSTKATTQFGSGWAWLVLGKDGLQIIQRPNQNSPYMDGLTPILGIDVWEHAYYLKYKNARPDYVKAWWDVVDWKAVADRYAKAVKG